MSHRHCHFQEGAQVWLFITLLMVQVSPKWDSGSCLNHFLHRKEVIKVSEALGRWQVYMWRMWVIASVRHSDKALVYFWVLLLLAQGLNWVLSDCWSVHSFLYWVTRSQFWNLRRFTSNDHCVLFLLLLYFIFKGGEWCGMVRFYLIS